MMMNYHVDEIMTVCIEEGVKLITTGAGSPGKYLEELHKHNIKVIPVVPSVALAKRMERLGVDAVVVEGTEAGGHVGELTTMALVPQVVDAISIPVIVAGGICTNRQLVAAFALGGIGVQVGTVLLATVECPIHDNFKQLVIESRDTSTVVMGRSKGVPVRNIKNQMTKDYIKLDQNGATAEELELMSIGGLRRAVADGDLINGAFMAGQVVGSIKEIKTVKQVFDELFDVKSVLDNLNNKFDNKG